MKRSGSDVRAVYKPFLETGRQSLIHMNDEKVTSVCAELTRLHRDSNTFS